jgi:hypothetical protein
LLSASKYSAQAVQFSPAGTARSRSGTRSSAPWASNSDQNAVLIEYKPTAVASTRGSVCLGCLLLVVCCWRWLVCIDHWLLAGGSWGLAVPFSELAIEVGHVGLVGELVQVRERSCCNSLCYTLGTRIKRAIHVRALTRAHGKQALHVRDEVLG